MSNRTFSITIILAFCLLFLLFSNTILLLQNKSSAAEKPMSATQSLRLQRLDETNSRLVIRFCESMAARSDLHKVLPKSPLIFDPPAIHQCRWIDFDELEVLAPGGLLPATSYSIGITSDLHTLKGKPVKLAKPLAFKTSTVKLTNALIDAGAPDNRLILYFNHPVNQKELEPLLTLTNGQAERLKFKLQKRSDQSCFLIINPSTNTSMPDPNTPLLITVTLNIAPGLKPKKGTLPNTKPIRRTVNFNAPLAVKYIKAEAQAITISLAPQVHNPDPSYIKLDPPCPFQFTSRWGNLELNGEFKPDSVIRVTLEKGFPGHGGYRLEKDYSHQVQLPPLAPKIEFATTGTILSSCARPEIDLFAVNVEKVQVSLRSLYPNNVITLAHASLDYPPAHIFGPYRNMEISLAGKPNRLTRRTIPLTELLLPRGKDTDSAELLVNGLGPGIHQIDFRIMDKPDAWLSKRTISRLIQITNLGVTARVAPGKVLVRVAGLGTGKPLAKAAVRVLSRTNQILAHGHTGADGTVLLTCRTSAPDEGPMVIEVRLGIDRTSLLLTQHGAELSADSLDGRPYCTKLEAYATFNRGIIRPGEKITATVIVRDQEGIGVAGQEVKLLWSGPDAKTRSTVIRQLPGSGMVTTSLFTGPAWRTGIYNLYVYLAGEAIGSSSFRVGAFVPNRLEINAQAAGGFRFGRNAEIHLQGNWLTGSPAALTNGRLNVRFDKHHFRPTGYTDYSFSRQNERTPGDMEGINFVLDDKGKGQVRFDFPADAYLPQTLSAVTTVELDDPSGRVVRYRFTKPVLQEGGHLGLKTGNNRGQLALLDHQGNPLASNAAVKLTLNRHYWTLDKQWRYNRWRYQSAVKTMEINSFTVKLTAGLAEFPIPLPPGKPQSWYSLTASLAGIRVDQLLGTKPMRPDTLRLSLLHDEPVKPGTTAKFSFDIPFGGNLFLSLEGQGIHGWKSIPVNQGHNQIEIGIPADLSMPNIHAIATLTRPQAGNSGNPCWLIGGTCIPLDQTHRACVIDVSMPSEVLPKDKVEINFNAPGATHAVVALVDEGILGYTQHSSPDPLAWFLARRRLDSAGADTGTSLFSTANYEHGVTQGGGYDDELNERLDSTISQRIKPLALSSKMLELDDLGNGVIAFNLPEYEGRLRAMIIAAGPQKVGATAIPLKVCHPLGLQLAAPRMVAPGDQTGIEVTIANQSGKDGTIELSLTALGGAKLSPGSPTKRDISLANGKHTSLFIPFTAGTAIGGQGLKCTAQLGDSKRQVEKLVSVRPLSQYTAERVGFAVEGKSKITFPGRWLEKKLSVKLHLGTNPERALLPALRDLIHYPYGCVEQTSSRCFALLSCRRLMQLLAKDKQRLPNVNGLLRDGINRLLAMQVLTGGLSSWASGRNEYFFGSVYGLDFLLAAQAAGLKVPARPLHQLTERVTGYLQLNTNFSLRCYAASVLARAKRPVAAWLERFAERATKAEDCFRLATALHMLGRKETARALLKKVVTREMQSREHGGMLSSQARTEALELQALLQINPTAMRIPELVAQLTQRLAQPGKCTTQEKGQGLLALAAFYSVAGCASGEDIRCTIAGENWEKQVSTPAVIQLGSTANTNFSISTTKRIYGFLEVTGYRLADHEKITAGLTLARRWLKPESMIDSNLDDLKALQRSQQVNSFHRGVVATVLVLGSPDRQMENWCLTDLLPGGFEFDGTTEDVRFWKINAKGEATLITPDRIELRDDRILVFHSGCLNQYFGLSYPARAVFPGTYKRASATLEALYTPGQLLTSTGGGTVEVGK